MEKIQVEVSLTGWLRRYTKEKEAFFVTLESGRDVLAMLRELNIPEGEVGSVLLVMGDLPEEKNVLDGSYKLKDGDRILLIPIILGG